MEMLGSVDVYQPSEEEVRSLFRRDVDLWKAAERLAEAGPSAVVVKCGPEGAIVNERHCKKHTILPPYPTDVVDVTGAGDSFCGGFMVGYAETGDAIHAALMGTASASLVIEAYGGLHALKRGVDEAARRMRRLEEMVRL